jgi:hypothetical protein
MLTPLEALYPPPTPEEELQEYYEALKSDTQENVDRDFGLLDPWE